LDIGEYTLAQQVKHAFIVTSAINSKFGVFTPAQRLEQTLATITSVKVRIPTAKIVLMECCGTPPTTEQQAQLEAASDLYIDYSRDPDVVALYDNDNWDVVKNGTEIMVFGRILQRLKYEDWFAKNNINRIHKMSGRYVLNDLFDPETYEQSDVLDKIVIGPSTKSQFSWAVTNVELQYMARLWSWPIELLDEVIKVYEDSLVFFAERLAAGGYVDIEHVLYKFLNKEHTWEIDSLGVEGQIAPNGVPIKN